MRTEVDTVEESAQIDEPDTPKVGGSQQPVLRMPPEAPEIAESRLRELRRRHLAVKLSGRPEGQDSSIAAGLVPISVFPYLEYSDLRTDYPVCVFDDAGEEPRPLTELMEQALSQIELEGDDLEYCKRWTLQLEHAIRQGGPDGSKQRLLQSWNASLETLSEHHRHDDRRRQLLHDTMAAVRERIPGDADLIGCDKTTAPTLLRALERNVIRKDDTEAIQYLNDLVRRLDDLLAVEREESDAGRTPDHLKESVGEAFEEALDFDALSSLLHDAPHGESLPANRRERIDKVLKTLREHLAELSDETPALHTFSSTVDLIDHVQTRSTEASTVSKAWLTARLEVEGRFDEERHAALLMPPDAGEWSQSWSLPTALPPLHLDFREQYPSQDVALLAELFERQVPVRILVTLGNVGGSDPSIPFLPVSLGERLISSARADGFLGQIGLTSVGHLVESMNRFLSSNRTAVLIVYDGEHVGSNGLPPFLKSGMAVESRVVPAFTMDAGAGEGWESRFTVAFNEQPERIWPQSEVEIELEDGARGNVETCFSAASYMFSDVGYDAHFILADRGDWHEGMVPIEEYNGESEKSPYLLAAAADGLVHRILTTDHVWRQMQLVGRRWRLLRELGGIENSFAAKAVADEKERLETEHQRRLEALESEHRSALESTTGQLAKQIVENIAAGLLDGSATRVAPLPQTAPAAPPSAPKTEVEAPVQPVEENEEETPPSDEEELELFDEAYIETPRCTTCDECTTINPRLFVYNESKQAYIADVSAGTYREMVQAAEKCPVRIIHPGKPLNPDEPHLDELLKRAEPFL